MTVVVAVTFPGSDRGQGVGGGAVGVTVVEPVAATLPTPLLIETLVAPCTIQVSVDSGPP